MKMTISCILLTLLICVSTAQAQTGPFSQQQARNIASAVVQILASGPNGPQQGSGTIVTPTGMIFTNAHVVDGADSIQIRVFEDFESAPEARYTASVTASVSEAQFDFAVLQISGNLNGSSINTNSLNLPYMPAQSIPINITEDVYFFAYPQIAGGSIAITPGWITTIQSIPVDGQEIFFYQSDAVFGEGASGGLVVNRQGQFIGIPSEMR
ncbi:MAG: trypsin-like peptidase domain-containing protein, partial [Anaerolineae bacterium]|nr:trypsin-like peptidase domain-containing protein [Anaerolineae bacterium]